MQSRHMYAHHIRTRQPGESAHRRHRRAPRHFASLLLLLCCIGVFPSLLFAQDKGKAQSLVVVQGTVKDTLKNPIPGAEVLVTDGRNRIITRVQSSEKGQFQFRTLKPGSYKFIARSVGFLNGVSKLMELGAGDTLDLEFVLDSNESTLAEVRVTAPANSPYRITSAEIAKTGYADALDVVLNRRIRMLGDTYKGCMSDTSTFTRDFRFIRKPPKSMSMDSSMPLQLYINGIRHSVRSIKDVLSEIPAKDIAELNYVDCWDKLRPALRNALLVVLKPGKRY